MQVAAERALLADLSARCVQAPWQQIDEGSIARYEQALKAQTDL